MTRSERVTMERAVAILDAVLKEDLKAVATVAKELAADLVGEETARREYQPEYN
jgi:hypothetical protein